MHINFCKKIYSPFQSPSLKPLSLCSWYHSLSVVRIWATRLNFNSKPKHKQWLVKSLQFLWGSPNSNFALFLQGKHFLFEAAVQPIPLQDIGSDSPLGQPVVGHFMHCPLMSHQQRTGALTWRNCKWWGDVGNLEAWKTFCSPGPSPIKINT